MRPLVLILLTLAAAWGQPPPPASDWVLFSGMWSATGSYETIPTEGPHEASLVRLSGAVTLTSGGLARGFSGEAIGFDDGRGVSAGRAVWTDSAGNRVFSVIEGESIAAGRKVRGTITGGSGRFAGASGDYTLTWQYVVRAEDHTLQGRAVDLRGRIRIGGGRP